MASIYWGAQARQNQTKTRSEKEQAVLKGLAVVAVAFFAAVLAGLGLDASIGSDAMRSSVWVWATIGFALAGALVAVAGVIREKRADARARRMLERLDRIADEGRSADFHSLISNRGK